MSVSVSTARILAPTAFAVNFAAQIYGMLSSPNMKEVADKVSNHHGMVISFFSNCDHQNHYAFSPSPVFIGAFFAPQMILQLAWIRKLFNGEVQSDDAQLQYMPIYALGNFCIGE